MANKTYGPADYGGAQSLTSLLAAKGITAKPGVSSGGTKAADRAKAFKAGATYTPTKFTGTIRGPVSPPLVNGKQPPLARGGQAPAQRPGAPVQGPQRGAQNFIPSSFHGAQSQPASGGGLMDFLRSAPSMSGQSAMPESAGIGPMLHDVGGAIGQWGQSTANSWEDAPQGRRWGGLGQEPRTAPDPISWLVTALWSMYGK